MHSKALHLAAIVVAGSISQAAAGPDTVDDYVLDANSQMFGIAPLPSAAPMRGETIGSRAESPQYRKQGDAVVVTMSGNQMPSDLVAQIRAATDALEAGKY